MTLELAEKRTIRVDLYQGTTCPEVFTRAISRLKSTGLQPLQTLFL
jgi:hypothetical protein